MKIRKHKFILASLFIVGMLILVDVIAILVLHPYDNFMGNYSDYAVVNHYVSAIQSQQYSKAIQYTDLYHKGNVLSADFKGYAKSKFGNSIKRFAISKLESADPDVETFNVLINGSKYVELHLKNTGKKVDGTHKDYAISISASDVIPKIKIMVPNSARIIFRGKVLTTNNQISIPNSIPKLYSNFNKSIDVKSRDVKSKDVKSKDVKSEDLFNFKMYEVQGTISSVSVSDEYKDKYSFVNKGDYFIATLTPTSTDQIKFENMIKNSGEMMVKYMTGQSKELLANTCSNTTFRSNLNNYSSTWVNDPNVKIENQKVSKIIYYDKTHFSGEVTLDTVSRSTGTKTNCDYTVYYIAMNGIWKISDITIN